MDNKQKNILDNLINKIKKSKINFEKCDSRHGDKDISKNPHVHFRLNSKKYFAVYKYKKINLQDFREGIEIFPDKAPHKEELISAYFGIDIDYMPELKSDLPIQDRIKKCCQYFMPDFMAMIADQIGYLEYILNALSKTGGSK